MKNLKEKFVFALVIALLAVWGAPRAEAAVKVTIKNNRSHTISLAFCWAGFDSPDDTSKGWYNVKAGETRTITFNDVEYHFTALDFGFYAKAGKTVWRGKESDERPRRYWIHPTKSFTGRHWDEESISGGQKVYFRPMNLKATGDSRTDATATLTFNN